MPDITRTIDGTTFVYSDVLAVPIVRYTTLASFSSLIILPNPLFGDTQSNIGNIIINRTVSGKVYTYIKTTQRQKLSYKFELKRAKARELQIFVDNNDLQWLTLTNWKAEVWKVRITNNPIIFEATGRGYNCPDNTEVHQVSLDFEGFKISAVPGGCS